MRFPAPTGHPDLDHTKGSKLTATLKKRESLVSVAQVCIQGSLHLSHSCLYPAKVGQESAKSPLLLGQNKFGKMLLDAHSKLENFKFAAFQKGFKAYINNNKVDA